MKSIGVTLQGANLTKNCKKETSCDIQLSSLIFLVRENNIETECINMVNIIILFSTNQTVNKNQWMLVINVHIAQKMKFSIKDLFSKSD